MTTKELDEKISQLKLQRKELEEKEIREFKIYAKRNVGRCFIINRQYCKVIDVPQEEQTKTGVNFNKYQYPAIFLLEGLVPFEEDTVFSGAWGDGHNFVGRESKEITKAEFEVEFQKRLDSLKRRIVEAI